MAHNVSSSDCNWWIKGRGVNIHGSPWAKGAGAGVSFSVGGYRVMAAKRSECQQWKGSSKVEACSDDGITTTMGHIWWETEAKDGVSFLCNNAQLSHLLSYTHLDCGSESVLSFNNSSEISVSRISGLDLFPYLRHTARQAGKRMNDYQAAEEFKALTPPPPTWTFCLSCDITQKKTRLQLNWAQGNKSDAITQQVAMSCVQFWALASMNTVRPRLCRGRQELYCRWSFFYFCLSDDKPCQGAFPTRWWNACGGIQAPDKEECWKLWVIWHNMLAMPVISPQVCLFVFPVLLVWCQPFSFIVRYVKTMTENAKCKEVSCEERGENVFFFLPCWIYYFGGNLGAFSHTVW